ncbi:Nickel-binding periplasmic protein precursor [Sporomusa ovata DSM 2662]|uniref:Nickel ABC transporter, periplasmic nickel-binding protein NikA (TC 3.A.1.5.3) n=1 Tax=Sporomusa ovata TaxID=2378 RepID=A0A0U1KU11_9FIRM|nr:nickel ABC transporter substrate-binding protein [Sporomusa ovata]EQB24957.1 nickel-binding periplasmic protein [Sporomusa ovata DSM 2662]CQR70154.1 Nickel ABC transporter, periplasmic nickel-binding protein NikA (TC 3.A.1.5.3) [Sporomusa ovata]
MSRKGIWLLVALILAIMLIAAGCGQQTAARKNTLLPGGEVAEVVSCDALDFTSFDVKGAGGAQGFFFHSALVYETLVGYQQGQIVPRLAESWEMNGREYVFHLKKGVMFTDGSPFNAAVVKLNLEMLKQHSGVQLAWFGAIAQLEAVEVVDEYTVKLIYKQPYYAALQDLTGVWTGMMSPKIFENGNIPYGKTFTATYGTGPYQLALEQSEKGKYYTFVRNEGYWGEKPKAKKYIVKIIPGLDARMMALRAGEVDFVVGERLISQDAVAQFRSDKNFGVKISEERMRTRKLLLNTARGPLMDAKVRKAIACSINKATIIKNILYDMEESADHVLNPNLPYCDVKVVPYEYNQEQARALLEEAGWKQVPGQPIREKEGQPLTLEMIYRTGYGSDTEVAQAVQGQLREIGIDARTAGTEMMTAYNKGTAGEFDIAVSSTYGLPYDPHTYISPMLNNSWDNPAQQGLSRKKEINEKIVRLFQTVDTAEIQEIYSYLLTVLHEEVVNVPIAYSKEVLIFNRNKIKDIDFSGLPNLVDISQITFNLKEYRG